MWYQQKGCAASDLWYSGTYFCMEAHGIGAATPIGGSEYYLYNPQIYGRDETTKNYFSLVWDSEPGVTTPGWTFTMMSGIFNQTTSTEGDEVTFTMLPPELDGSGEWICSMQFTLDPYWSANCLSTNPNLDAMITLQFYPNYNDIYEPMVRKEEMK